jgi:hypothetical protein
VAHALIEAKALCGLNLLRSPVTLLILVRCDYYDYVGGYSLLQTLQTLLHLSFQHIHIKTYIKLWQSVALEIAYFKMNRAEAMRRY